VRLGVKVRVSLRHLSSRPFQTISAVFVVALSSALAVMLFLLAQGLRDGLIRAVEPFDLIVGAKGSPYQIVLNTVLLQDVPVGNLKWSDYVSLREDPRVDISVPLAFGDNYRGCPVVGTAEDILRIRGGQPVQQWIDVAEGRWFDKEFEAVLGAQAALESGLLIGDTFRTSHGVVLGEEHDVSFEVVGVAARAFGPYDRAIFVSIESVWESHDHDDDDGEEEKDEGEVTAILVRPATYPDAYSLAVSFQHDTERQLVFPAQTAIRLFSLMGSGERFLSIIVYSVAACSLLTTLLVLYWSNRDRRRERALLYALGAPRGTLVTISWIEGTFTLAIGALIGELLGRAGVYAAFHLLGDATAIDLSAPMTIHEAVIPIIMLAAGSFGGFLIALSERTGDSASLKIR
jgi:putative ABC transport system permease protein